MGGLALNQTRSFFADAETNFDSVRNAALPTHTGVGENDVKRDHARPRDTVQTRSSIRDRVKLMEKESDPVRRRKPNRDGARPSGTERDRVSRSWILTLPRAFTSLHPLLKVSQIYRVRNAQF